MCAARVARRGNPPSPAASGKGKAYLSVQTPFNVSTTPTNRGRAPSSSGSTPPRTVWKPQSHWLMADWLVGEGEANTIRGRICPHPRFNKPSVSPSLRQPGDDNDDPLGRRPHRPARCGNGNNNVYIHQTTVCRSYLFIAGQGYGSVWGHFSFSLLYWLGVTRGTLWALLFLCDI